MTVPRSLFSFTLLPILYIVRIFFFNDPATTEIYTLSLHDALPISGRRRRRPVRQRGRGRPERQPAEHAVQRAAEAGRADAPHQPPKPDHPARTLAQLLQHTRQRDRKSTRLNSSHPSNSYAVVCCKK